MCGVCVSGLVEEGRWGEEGGGGGGRVLPSSIHHECDLLLLTATNSFTMAIQVWAPCPSSAVLQKYHSPCAPIFSGQTERSEIVCSTSYLSLNTYSSSDSHQMQDPRSMPTLSHPASLPARRPPRDHSPRALKSTNTDVYQLENTLNRAIALTPRSRFSNLASGFLRNICRRILHAREPCTLPGIVSATSA